MAIIYHFEPYSNFYKQTNFLINTIEDIQSKNTDTDTTSNYEVVNFTFNRLSKIADFDSGLCIPFTGETNDILSLNPSESEKISLYNINNNFFPEYWSLLSSVRDKFGEGAAEYMVADSPIGYFSSGDLTPQPDKYGIARDYQKYAIDMLRKHNLVNWASGAYECSSETYITSFYRGDPKHTFLPNELNYIRCLLPFFYRIANISSQETWVALLKCDNSLKPLYQNHINNFCYSFFKKEMLLYNRIEKVKKHPQSFSNINYGMDFIAVKLENPFYPRSGKPIILATASPIKMLKYFNNIYDF